MLGKIAVISIQQQSQVCNRLFEDKNLCPEFWNVNVDAELMQGGNWKAREEFPEIIILA